MSYVGKTTRPERRFYGHLSSLRGGRHPVLAMQSDFHLYGEENFEVVIIGWYSYKSRDAEAVAIEKYSILNLCYNRMKPNVQKLQKEMHNALKIDRWYSAHYEHEFLKLRKVYPRSEVAKKFPWMGLNA